MLKRVFWCRNALFHITKKILFFGNFILLSDRGACSCRRRNFGGDLIWEDTYQRPNAVTWVFEPLPYKDMTMYHEIISRDRLSGSSAHFFSVRSFQSPSSPDPKEKTWSQWRKFPTLQQVSAQSARLA